MTHRVSIGFDGEVPPAGLAAIERAFAAHDAPVPVELAHLGDPDLATHPDTQGVPSARLADARTAGCDVAVIVTQPGSESHQNAQRRGFDLLYTRATLVMPP